MARGPLYLTIRDPNSGRPIRDAQASVQNRDNLLDAPVYLSETGLTLATLRSNHLGVIAGWMDPGRYVANLFAPGYQIHPYIFDIFESDIDAVAITQAELTTQLNAHDADTTNVHGIADTSRLITQDNIEAHTPAPNLAPYATNTALAAHEADTTNVHGIADTALLSTRADLADLVTIAPATSARNVVQSAAGASGLVLRGAVAQTANPFEVQTNAGAAVLSVTASGDVRASTDVYARLGNANQVVCGFSTAGAAVRFGSALDAQIARTGADELTIPDRLVQTSPAAGTVPSVVRGFTAQIANLQEWQDSASTVKASVSADGSLVNTSKIHSGTFLQAGNGLIYLGNSSNNPTINSSATTTDIKFEGGNNAAATRLIVRGKAAQSMNLQEWQNDAGVSQLSVSATGIVRWPGDNLRIGNFDQMIGDGLGAGKAYIAGLSNQTAMVIYAPAINYRSVVKFINDNHTYWEPSVSTVVPLGARGLGVTATVTNKALTGNVATLTTAAAHSFVVGRSVVVAGVDATFNGTYTIVAVPTTTTFTYTKIAADVASVAAAGTAASYTQTANLFTLANNAGTAQFAVGPEGAFSAMGTAFQVNKWSATANIEGVGGVGLALQTFSGGNVIIGAGSSAGLVVTGASTLSKGVAVATGAAATVGLIVTGAASQTAALQEWRNSAGTPLVTMSANGTLSLFAGSGDQKIVMGGAGTSGFEISRNNTTGEIVMAPQAFATAGIRMQSGLAAQVPLAVRGHVSQTANLQEWQDSTGAVKAHVTATGLLVAPPFSVTGDGISLSGSYAAIRSTGTAYIDTLGATSPIHLRPGGGTTTRATFDSTGGLELLTAGKGVTLKSPDGLTTKTLTIDNAGNLVTT